MVDGRVPVLIEVKSRYSYGAIEPLILKTVARYMGEYAIQSFSPKTVRWFKRHAPGVPIGYICGTYQDSGISWILKFLLPRTLLVCALRPDFVSLEIPLLQSKLRLWLFRLANIPILAWAVRTKNEESSVRDVADNIIFENYMPTTL